MYGGFQSYRQSDTRKSVKIEIVPFSQTFRFEIPESFLVKRKAFFHAGEKLAVLLISRSKKTGRDGAPGKLVYSATSCRNGKWQLEFQPVGIENFRSYGITANLS